MFFPIPSQPMDTAEETAILLETGCSSNIIETLISFAEKYRLSLSDDIVQKNRKLGTRSLVRIATRLAKFPQGDDLNAVISRSLLAEFLPAMERMNLDTLLQETGIMKSSPRVRQQSAYETSKDMTFTTTSSTLRPPYKATSFCFPELAALMVTWNQHLFLASTLRWTRKELLPMCHTWITFMTILCRLASCGTSQLISSFLVNISCCLETRYYIPSFLSVSKLMQKILRELEKTK
jgi:hypothetical protein